MPRARVVATPPPNRPGPGCRGCPGLPPLPAGYVIALLNPQYLKQQLIPRLVERHFVKGPDGALLVAIKGAQGVVYATDGAVPQALDHADVTEQLWEIRFHEFSRFVQDRRSAGAARRCSRRCRRRRRRHRRPPWSAAAAGRRIIEHRIVERRAGLAAAREHQLHGDVSRGGPLAIRSAHDGQRTGVAGAPAAQRRIARRRRGAGAGAQSARQLRRAASARREHDARVDLECARRTSRRAADGIRRGRLARAADAARGDSIRRGKSRRRHRR